MRTRLARASRCLLAAALLLATPPALAEDVDAGALIEKATRLYEALEFDQVIPVAEEVLKVEGLDIELKLKAYLLLAQCVAVVGDPVDAEAPFRLLLRAKPDFALPEGTAPKIVGVFRKVQAEEKAMNEEIEMLRRKQIREGLAFVGEPPKEGRGGRPLSFAFRLKDPTSAVDMVQIPYRRKGEPAYSMLALKRDDEGVWRGTIPGEWTASEADYVVEYYVQSFDAKGSLLELGEEGAPLSAVMDAGKVERRLPKPLPRWAFVTGAVLTGGLTALGGGLGFATRDAQKDYDAYAARGLDEPIDGALLQQMAEDGQRLQRATNASLISAAAVGLISVGMIPFTRWGPPEDAP
ncbi:MAG: hypothetical protein P1V51_15735 [Deltaproteobacteria bacterium]|nr:hypothetical protein [Deltaproteobacteria bacterium]